MADEDVQVRFGANIQGIVAGVNDVKAQIESLADSAASIRSTFAGVGTGLAELFAIDQIAGYADRMSDLGEQAIRMSSMLGLGVEEVQKLGFAAKMTGGDAEGMAMSMGRFERNIAEAQSGTGKAYEAFQNLGISLQDLKTKTPEQLLGQVANAFAGAADGATKYAYAVDLGGRTWGQMIPLLDQGSGGLERMGVTAEQTGSILTQELAEAFEKTHQNIVVMDASLKGTSVTMFSAFLPAVNAIVNGMADLAQWFNEAAKSGGSMREIILLVEAAFDGLVMGIESGIVGAKTAIEGLAVGFYDLKIAADMVVTAIKDLFVGLGKAIKDALTGNFSSVKKDYTDAINQMKADWAAGMHEMSNASEEFANDTILSWAELQKRANEMWAALTGVAPKAKAATKKPDLPPAPTGSSGSDKDTRDQFARETTNTQVELSKLAFEQISQDQTALVNQFKETEADKVQALIAATELMVETEQSALDKEAAGYTQDSLAYQQVQDRKKILAAQAALEISRLNEQLAAAQKKQYEQELAPWKQLMSDMGGAFDTMVNGILSGTQTFRGAMARAFDDLAIKFAEVISKMLAEYAVFSATGGKGILGFGGANPFAALGGAAGGAGNSATQALTSAITGNTASTVSNTGGILQEIESGLQWIAETLGLTASTTAQTASSAAAATASTASATATTGLIPTITANIAALAANTTALFASKAVPSFDVGTWSAPGGLSMLHPGEIVIPPGISAGVRAGTTSIGGVSGGSGGGGMMIVNLSVNAVDSQSVSNLFKNNGGALASALAAQMRNFNPNLKAA